MAWPSGAPAYLAAERGAGPAGFISLDQETAGYIDLAFILPEARGAGLFGALYAALERQAEVEKITRLWVHASLMSQPVFASRGFAVVRHEEVAMGAQKLARAEMEKRLA